MVLLITASMYSRFLAMGGAVGVIQGTLFSVSDSPIVIMFMIFLVWLILGMFIDSTSIILLTVPIFAPMSQLIGIEPLAFAIFGILVIEAGLLTPPFGLLVFTVKASVPDSTVTMGEIFRGAIPYWIMILIVAVLVVVFPVLATFLPQKPAVMQVFNRVELSVKKYDGGHQKISLFLIVTVYQCISKI